MLIDHLRHKFKKPEHDTRYRSFWQFIHIDVLLLIFILMLCSTGLFILYSASGENLRTIEFQSMRMLLSLVIMFLIAQNSSRHPATCGALVIWNQSLVTHHCFNYGTHW